MPGSFPSPIFDITNHGGIQRHSVLSIRAGDGDLEKDRKVASLTVSPTDGVMRFEGGGVEVPGGLSGVGGLSETDVASHNFRGVGVPVKAGPRELVVMFPRPETDAHFAVLAETRWVTARGISQQSPDGFVVDFPGLPTADGKIHWLIVR